MAKKDYKNLSKEQLIEEINKITGKKKYGLVWDEDRVPEKVVLDCQDKLPVLMEVKGKEIVGDKNGPNHILIEGDNYHALSVLNYTHKGKIDVIYVDPPYNTGAKDWKYNNAFVDANDGWRHSKWIQFMYNRLVLAKELLKDDGVLIVTIDDYEMPNLTVLLNDLGAKSLGRATICIKPEGRRQSKYLMEAHEYALFCSWGNPKIRGLNADFGLDFPEEDEVSKFRWEGLMRRDAGREDRGSDYWYPLYVTKDEKIHFTEVPDSIKMDPINSKGIERVWLWDRDRAIENVSELKATIRKDKVTIYYKRREQGRVKPTTFWFGSKYNANAYGTRLLQKILPETNFDYPKSVFSVLDCIDLFLPENGIVLDFFAGSGTTGHATLMLNKEEGGENKKRQFILSTNNENGICEEVTYERIKRVIKGYANVAGLPGNLKYFRTAFVPNNRNKDQLKIDITKRCTEMLCLKEGVYKIIRETSDYKIFQEGKKYLAVYYDFATSTLDELKDEMNKLKGEKVFYCFTLDSYGLDNSNFKGWKNIRIEPIPQKILEVYKRIFKN